MYSSVQPNSFKFFSLQIKRASNNCFNDRHVIFHLHICNVHKSIALEWTKAKRREEQKVAKELTTFKVN